MNLGGREGRWKENKWGDEIIGTVQLHFEQVMLKIKACIYRDEDKSQHSHLMFTGN